MANKLPKTFQCSTEFTLAVLGGKWKTVILCYLTQRPLRYSELRRLLPSLSDKVLTERLHELLAAGLVAHRKSDGRAASETYALTARARSLADVLRVLYQWGRNNAALFHVKVGEPLAKLDKDKARL